MRRDEEPRIVSAFKKKKIRRKEGSGKGGVRFALNSIKSKLFLLLLFFF